VRRLVREGRSKRLGVKIVMVAVCRKWSAAVGLFLPRGGGSPRCGGTAKEGPRRRVWRLVLARGAGAFYREPPSGALQRPAAVVVREEVGCRGRVRDFRHCACVEIARGVFGGRRDFAGLVWAARMVGKGALCVVVDGGTRVCSVAVAGVAKNLGIGEWCVWFQRLGPHGEAAKFGSRRGRLLASGGGLSRRPG